MRFPWSCPVYAEVTRIPNGSNVNDINEWLSSGSVCKHLPHVSDYVESAYIVSEGMEWICMFSNWWDFSLVFFRSEGDAVNFLKTNSHIDFYEGDILKEDDLLDMMMSIFPSVGALSGHSPFYYQE